MSSDERTGEEVRHTPEPWYAVYYPLHWCIQDGPSYEDGDLFCDDPDRAGEISEAKAKANAARAVACVNALAGVADPAAELARLRSELKAAMEEGERLMGKPYDALREIRGDVDDDTLVERLVAIQGYLRHGKFSLNELRSIRGERHEG